MKIAPMLKICMSLPKTLYLNFNLFPIKKAVKLPIVVSYDTKICINEGRIALPELIKPFMIRIGFHECDECNSNDQTLFKVGGLISFKGEAHIGHGAKIIVYDGGMLELGDNFAISASSVICCYKHIVFGKDIQFSWDCLVMDSDTHLIFDDFGNQINQDKEIIFGNKVWIGNGCMILKGTKIPDTCVIGAKSVVSGAKYSSHTIIAGNPARSIKNIGDFKI